MPQNRREVAPFDFRTDMCQYYRHSIVTYINPQGERIAASVNDFRGEGEDLIAVVHLLRQEGDWSEPQTVPLSQLDLSIPPLGPVFISGAWIHLQRVPARRMRKGYNTETISWAFLEDSPIGIDYGVTSEEVVRQVWYGQPDRISNSVVVWGKGIYYMTDKVATIDDEGQVILIPNKEKLGEFVCKALASNWEVATSKHSVRTLPSFQQMP